MTLEELEENEDEFGEDDEAAIEMYRWVEIMQFGALGLSQSFFSIQSWPDLLQFTSTEVAS